MICADYEPAFEQALEQNALIEHGDGETYTYMYYTSKFFTVGQFDFTAPNRVPTPASRCGYRRHSRPWQSRSRPARSVRHCARHILADAGP